MNRMKYVVTKNEQGKEEIFIFPVDVHHDVMYHAVSRLKDSSRALRWVRIDRELVSAGFYENGLCYGRSESLNVESRGQIDEQLI